MIDADTRQHYAHVAAGGLTCGDTTHDHSEPLADPAAEERVQGAMELERRSRAQQRYDDALANLTHANDIARSCRRILHDELGELLAARQAVHRRWSEGGTDTHDDAVDGPRATCIGCR